MAQFVDRALKRRYIDPPNGLESVVNRASPTLASIKKVEKRGESVNEICRPSGPLGFSYDFAAAQAVSGQTDKGASDYETFVLPFGQYFGSVVMPARGLSGAKGREDAFLLELITEMDAALESFGSIAARKILGPIGGSIGRIEDIDQGGTSGQIALHVKGDAFNFIKGMILQAASGTGNGSTTPRAGLGYVLRVVPDANLTGSSTTGWHVEVSDTSSSGSVGTPSGWVDNDYLFRNGDILSATDLSDKAVRSLQGFITLTNDTSTYLNAARTTPGMNGFRLTSTEVDGLTIKERIMKLVNKGRKQYNANKVDTIVVGPDTHHDLVQEVQDTGWQGFAQKMEVGAGEIAVWTANGVVKVLNEPHCIESDIWALTSSKLSIFTYNGFPGPVDEDGLKLLRKATSMDYEVRWQAFNCLSVGGSPWHFGRCDSGTAVI